MHQTAARLCWSDSDNFSLQVANVLNSTIMHECAQSICVYVCLQLHSCNCCIRLAFSWCRAYHATYVLHWYFVNGISPATHNTYLAGQQNYLAFCSAIHHHIPFSFLLPTSPSLVYHTLPLKCTFLLFASCMLLLVNKQYMAHNVLLTYNKFWRVSKKSKLVPYHHKLGAQSHWILWILSSIYTLQNFLLLKKLWYGLHFA